MSFRLPNAFAKRVRFPRSDNLGYLRPFLKKGWHCWRKSNLRQSPKSLDLRQSHFARSPFPLTPTLRSLLWLLVGRIGSVPSLNERIGGSSLSSLPPRLPYSLLSLRGSFLKKVLDVVVLELFFRHRYFALEIIVSRLILLHSTNELIVFPFQVLRRIFDLRPLVRAFCRGLQPPSRD